ncbi:hypothetical protein Tco_0981157 [Tanacetum coccineum]
MFTISRLKFVRIGEDYQEYGLPIPNMMLNNAIKQSESYQMFLKYSTSQIPPKKSRGKGSQGKKSADTPVTDVDVSEESDSELARNRIASRRVVKKKVIISAVDNIIPDPDVALKLESKPKPAKKRLVVPDESTVVPATSRERTGTKLGVPDKEKVTSIENVILEWGFEQESENSKEDERDDEEVDWIYSDEEDEKKDDAEDDKISTWK